ncbi:hypothetical protein ACET60_15220 [Aeromonas veronii]
MKREFDESLGFDDYYFQLEGASCYLVFQRKGELQACKNNFQKVDDFVAFVVLQRRDGWEVVADMVVVNTKAGAIRKIRRLKDAFFFVRSICLVNILLMASNPVGLYCFIMLVGAFLACDFISIVLSSMRTESFNLLSSTQIMGA